MSVRARPSAGMTVSTAHLPPDHPVRILPAAASRILIVSDAWMPQVNGVVRTLRRPVQPTSSPSMGHRGRGGRSRPLPHPAMPDLSGHQAVAVLPDRRLVAADRGGRFRAGLRCMSRPKARWARPPGGWARRARLHAFTTAFHTRFAGIRPGTHRPADRPRCIAWLRHFHNAGRRHDGRDRQPAHRAWRHARLRPGATPGPAASTSELFRPPAADAQREDWDIPRPLFA